MLTASESMCKGKIDNEFYLKMLALNKAVQTAGGRVALIVE